MTLPYFGLNTPDWWEEYFESGLWTTKGGRQQTIDHMRLILGVLLEFEIYLEGKEVLDVGCALGEGTQILYEAGAEAMGADFSHTAISECRLRYPHLGFIQSDAREVMGYYDIIVTSHLIEHMGDDVERTLRHLKTHCDMLVASVPIASLQQDHSPQAKQHHTGLVKSAIEAFPPNLTKQGVCIWSM